MSDLEALYQEMILDHNRSPRNFRAMADADRTAEGRNPMCGDELTVWIKLNGGQIADISFQGTGCALSKASASLMTQAVQGVSVEEAIAMGEKVRAVVTRGAAVETLGDGPLSRLRVLGGVARFPARVKCATLAWHAMQRALSSDHAAA